MSFSSVSLALLDYPNVWQGFWHSHGALLPKGPMLTVSAFWFTFLSSGIALLLGWAISRLWRLLEVLVFRIVLKKSKKSLNQSQCAVLLVNTKAPLDAFFTSIQLMRPRGPNGTAAIIFCAASAILAATIAIPAMIALLPVYQQGILIPVYHLDPNERRHSGFVSKQIKLADTVLALLDRGSLNSSLKSVSQTAPIPIPALSHSYVKECPANATCHPAFPFTFSSNYTLHSSHFGLNIKSPFSLSVYETCYRPPQVVVALNHTDDPFEFALLYGPRRLNTLSLRAEYTNQTEVVHREDFSTGQYRLTHYSALVDVLDDPWVPNSTLILGGDTTILFYFVGGIAMMQGPPSTDPIFARKQHIRTPDQFGDWFVDTQDLVVPIICDTKYRICVDRNDCSPVGGWDVIQTWETLEFAGFDDQKTKLGTFLFEALKSPPISRASSGSDAVVASHTLFHLDNNGYGQDQTDPHNVTVVRELSRLAQAGMAILASGFQLQTLGYWIPPVERSAKEAYRYCHGTPDSLCGAVIIDNPSVFTLPLIPYAILLVMVFVIIIVSYMGNTRFMRRFGFWRKYAELWSLHCAGQLHREVVEQIGGTFYDVDVTHEWPYFNEAHVGLDIVEKHGFKRFSVHHFCDPNDSWCSYSSLHSE